ncbi:MAG: hypothetical protein QHH04_06935 [Methanolinea sp.]|nr:hypothetical protein [Methanolinea sp.]
MVKTEGQLYTIEGIAASVLVMTTIYLVLNTTTILTPGETHVYDMQLEQLGNDILGVMDFNETWVDNGYGYTKSPLQNYIETNDGPGFGAHFLNLAKMTVGKENFADINLNANITYRTGSHINSYNFNHTRDYSRERAVKITRWVNIDDKHTNPHLEARNQTVLLEVLLWRG